MNNLIPPEFQKKLYFIYLGRLSVVAAVLCIFIAVVFCAALVPSYVLTHQRLSIVRTELTELQKSESLKADTELKKVLQESKAIVDLADSAIPPLSYGEYIKKIIAHKIPGVTIELFDFQGINSAAPVVVLSGVAQNRDVLVQFAKSFSADAHSGFGTVTIPVESFQKKAAIPFSLTVPIVLKEEVKKQ